MMMRQEHDTPGDLVKTSSGGLALMSLASLVVYAGLAWVLVRFFHDAPPAAMFQHGFPWPVQLVVGATLGVLAALVISRIMFRTAFSSILKDYAIVQMLSEMRLSRFDRLQISLFAGAGEELLFRGAIQPLLGIWVTSFLFVALHGYFRFHSIRHVLFGVIFFALSVGLGWLFQWAGLLAAMAAHAAYDYVMLVSGERYSFGRDREDVSPAEPVS
ncbi:CPBP family intramembrane metalloprotease [Balneolales bacterium ANBcel1]|nr:CPBP family intramembrane metalloprotease [Balneolales bacterium ANBcel1]